MSGTYNATIRRVVISAWTGSSIEYYDFLLYGLASALVFGALFAAAMAFPFFWLLESRSLILMTMGYVLLINIGHNSLNAVQPSFFAGLFHPPVRYSGSSIGAQLGAVVAGGIHAVYR